MTDCSSGTDRMKIVRFKNHQLLQAIYEQSVITQEQKIVSDPTHSLHTEFQLLSFGRKPRVPKSRLNNYKCYFLPVFIKPLNTNISDRWWVVQYVAIVTYTHTPCKFICVRCICFFFFLFLFYYMMT